MRRGAALLATAAIAAGCGGDAQPAADVPGTPAIPPRLVQALRDGGHVLLFRHATTETDAEDREEAVGDCATQRNLSDRGRREAREIGAVLAQVDIPIGDVRASPLCRTLDTAHGLFGRATADPRLLSPGLSGTEADDRRRVGQLRELADTPPTGDANTAIVTHTGNIAEAFGGESVLEGGALVFRPDGDGEPEIVARIPPDAWALLAGS